MRDGNEIVCRVQTDLGIETPLYSLCSGLPSLRMGRTNSKTACSHPSGWRPAHHNHVPLVAILGAQIGSVIGDASVRRDEIVAAIDLLASGF